ncbi:MarR family transcriptional regulator [Altererythrobacter sp. KTW20L]|uniref:MarR family winged helix-turn-helix transcriptional regulator n=1 Tax=Altererythrobacter sp. KTW20L TaxID=2942210 RepID=UPI0020C01E1A|nr:MarR family transcriptional regulator [Altererythrobacter sp. KTW20L]MCL6249661.1 MarR family transcriptional regulator [Altererythrobacter sp. KTW20L]
MRDPLPSYPGYSLRRAANATAADLSARLGAIGMKQVDASILLLLADNPEVTASALGRQLDIQRANMVPLLKRLEDAGLIARTPIDGKSQGLALTEEGRETMTKARVIIDRFESELLARVPAEHRDHLLPALDALWR